MKHAEEKMLLPIRTGKEKFIKWKKKAYVDILEKGQFGE